MKRIGSVKNPHRTTMVVARLRPEDRVKFEQLAALEGAGPSTFLRLLAEKYIAENEHVLARKRKKPATPKRFVKKRRKR